MTLNHSDNAVMKRSIFNEQYLHLDSTGISGEKKRSRICGEKHLHQFRQKGGSRTLRSLIWNILAAFSLQERSWK